MWAVKMVNHCSISKYLLNSGVVHAVSTGVAGPYQEAEQVLVPFAHEPDVVRAPTGELVMSTVTGPVGDAPGGSGHPSCFCVNGVSNLTCDCDNLPQQKCVPQTSTLSVATAVDGPWASAPMGGPRWHGAENPSIWITRNGSLFGCSRGGATSVFAADWKNGSTYVKPPTSISGGPDVEGPFVWQDENDHWHHLSHNLEEAHFCPSDRDCLNGGHAYSLDGLNWLYGGVAFGTWVNMTDGSVLHLNRRERHHLVFAEGTRRPVALSFSAVVGGHWKSSFTMVQELIQ